MGFKVLYLKEHEDYIPPNSDYIANTHKIDTRIFILYDPEDSNFYYYGKRNYAGGVEYSGTYSRFRIAELIEFLDYLFGKLIITNELHDIDIEYSEYGDLSFNTLLNKLGKYTEMAAYDCQHVKKKNIYNMCKMLISY